MAAEPRTILEEREIQRMRTVFCAQRHAFTQAPMPSARDRQGHLDLLKDALIAWKERLAEAISEDFGGRSRYETLAEVLSCVQGLKYARRRLPRWMKPARRRAGLLLATTRARVYYQPKGVVGIMVPWNYPVALSVGPLVCALAAGNRVMVKTSEATPRTSDVIREMLSSVFPEDQVAVFHGRVEAGRAFAALDFDHLLFTGSTEVGRKVMRAAADNLTPVTLELGGKSPTLITSNVDMALAAERIAFGKAFNAGQTCVAPDYVLCPSERVDEFVEAFRGAFRKMYPELVGNEDYTSVVNAFQYDRLQGYLEEARDLGAEVIELNPAAETMPPGSHKMPMYLVKGVSDEMAMMREEIFGPILPIVPYDHIDEALAYINARPRPLALNLFDFDAKRRRRILEMTHSGGVCVNDAISHFIAEDLPFGGVGDSGMGHYHAYEGFLTFSHHKAVFSRPRINTSKALYAPHGHWLQRLVFRLFLR